jgi:hypothetical protein
MAGTRVAQCAAKSDWLVFVSLAAARRTANLISGILHNLRKRTSFAEGDRFLCALSCAIFVVHGVTGRRAGVALAVWRKRLTFAWLTAEN